MLGVHFFSRPCSGPLWESRSLPLDPRLMEEGPRELYSETINGQQQQPSGKLQRYFVVRYESLVKDPSKIAMEVLRWAKDVVVPDGLANTPSRLLARAEVSQKGAVGNLPACIRFLPFSLESLQAFGRCISILISFDPWYPLNPALRELRECPRPHGARAPRAHVWLRPALQGTALLKCQPAGRECHLFA